MVRTTALLLGLIATAAADLLAFTNSPAGPLPKILKGQVRDPEGRPIAGAEVWVRPERWGTEGARPDAHTEGPAAISGPDGGFEIPDLPLQDLEGLIVCRKGYIQRLTLAEDLAAGDVRVVLSPATPLSGRVTDPKGKPVAGAQISVLLSGASVSCLALPPGPCPSHEFTRADEEGRFHLDLRQPGWYNVNVYSEKYLSSRLERVRVLPAVGLAGLKIALEEGVVVEGRVLTAEGRPIQGARLSLSGGRSASSDLESRGDGSYRFDAIEPGKRTLDVEHPDFSSEWRETQVPLEGMRLDIVLHPRQRTFIRGWVAGPDGRPTEGAVVSSAHDTQTTTSADGTFELEVNMEEVTVEGLDNETWLRAEKEGYGPGFSGILKPPVDGVEVRLNPGITLTGRLLGLEPEELTEARVSVYWRDGYSPKGESVVDAEGRYRVQDLAPGTWTISTNAGSQRLKRTLTLEAGSTEVIVDLIFDPTFEIRGRVMGPEGEPIKTWLQFDHPDGTLQSVWTREDGSYSIRLKDGTWKAVTNHRGYFNGEKKVVPVNGSPVDGVDFHLEKSVVLTGRFLGFQPGELTGSVKADGPVSWWGEIVDQEGNYHIPGLGPGEWDVTAVHTDFGLGRRTAQGRITIPSGATEATLDLDFSLGPLTLSVRLASAGEVEDLALRLLRPDGTELIDFARRFDDGTFRFHRLREGGYRIQVRDGDGQVLAEQAVELGADMEVVVEVAPP
jgi:hypothetical protein